MNEKGNAYAIAALRANRAELLGEIMALKSRIAYLQEQNDLGSVLIYEFERLKRGLPRWTPNSV
jgi:hypothetical protein